MDKYIKIKELEEVSGCKIEDIKELTSGKLYLIGVQVGGIRIEMIPPMLNRLKEAFEEENIKTILYPIREDLPQLKIYETEPKVKDISYMYQDK